MSLGHFILLLCVYGFVVILDLVASKSRQEHAAALNFEAILKSKPRNYLWLMVLALGLIMVSGLIGFIGLFLFWHLAPWIFAFAMIGKIAFQDELSPLKSTSALRRAVDVLEFLFEGIILVLVFVGPARRWFFV